MKRIIKRTVPILLFITLFACNVSNIDKELTDMAASMNKKAPMVNGSLRFDSMTVDLPGRIIQYNVTILDQTREMIDTEALDDEIPQTAAQMKKTIPDNLKGDNVTIIYSYSDMLGQQAHKITITPDMYR